MTTTENPPIRTERSECALATVTKHTAHEGYALPPVRELEHLIAQVLPSAPDAAETPIKVRAERYSDAANGVLPTREVLLSGRDVYDVTISPRDALAVANAIRRAAQILLADEGAAQTI